MMTKENKANSAEKKTRVYQRAQVTGRVMIHDEEKLFIAPLNNISAGGLFIDQLVSIPKGSEVRIVVKSSRFDAPVQAVGTVVRIEEEDRRGLAVEFTAISKQAQEIIQACVAEARLETAIKTA